MYLIFDSYGTLMELDDFYGRLQLGFARDGANLPHEVVVRAAHAEMRFYMSRARFARCFDSWNALRIECAEVLADAVREQGHKLDLSREQTVQILSDAVVYRPLPGARDVLEELKKRGAHLAVLSNWDFSLPKALEEAELARFFDWILPSAQVGKEKPAREFFQKGVELARRFVPNLKPRDCFYVGDHYEKDVLGARRAGLRPLWLVRDVRDLPSGEIHDAQDDVPRLRSLQDLLKLF